MNLWPLFLAFVALMVQDSRAEDDISWIMERSADSANKTMPSWAANYTRSSDGCPCWFNLYMNATSCACCHNDGVQCGFPMHQYCQAKMPGKKQYGCPGVPGSKYTLSTKGHPCLPKGSGTDCAWCVPGAKQCNKMKPPVNHLVGRSSGSLALEQHVKYIKDTWSGSICVDISDNTQCIGAPTSCDVSPNICGANAHCKMGLYNKTMSDEFQWNIGICICNEGFVGNGFQCANMTTGHIYTKQDEEISLSLQYTKDIYNVPIGTKRPGSAEDNFFDALELIHNNGTGVCGAGCTADVAYCGAREPVCNGGMTPAIAVFTNHG